MRGGLAVTRRELKHWRYDLWYLRCMAVGGWAERVDSADGHAVATHHFWVGDMMDNCRWPSHSVSEGKIVALVADLGRRNMVPAVAFVRRAWGHSRVVEHFGERVAG